MATEASLEFMTGNPQLGVLSGRLTYLDSSSGSSREGGTSGEHAAAEGEKEKEEEEEEDADERHTASDLDVAAAETSLTDLDLPQRRSTLLCILSVPAYMIPTDMLQFAAPFKEHVHAVRILRPCNPVGPSDPARTPAEYMVLLQMESQVMKGYVWVWVRDALFYFFVFCDCQESGCLCWGNCYYSGRV